MPESYKTNRTVTRQSLSSLDRADRVANPIRRRLDPHNDMPAADPVVAAEGLLTTAQKDNIERRYGKVATAKPNIARFPYIYCLSTYFTKY